MKMGAQHAWQHTGAKCLHLGEVRTCYTHVVVVSEGRTCEPVEPWVALGNGLVHARLLGSVGLEKSRSTGPAVAGVARYARRTRRAGAFGHAQSVIKFQTFRTVEFGMGKKLALGPRPFAVLPFSDARRQKVHGGCFEMPRGARGAVEMFRRVAEHPGRAVHGCAWAVEVRG